MTLNYLFTASDEGFISVTVFLDLSAAFDSLDDHIIQCDWSPNWLQMIYFKMIYVLLYKFVHVNDEWYRYDKFSHGVPQGSVLGPILFTSYILPLCNIIRKQSNLMQMTQLYLSMKPDEIHL